MQWGSAVIAYSPTGGEAFQVLFVPLRASLLVEPQAKGGRHYAQAQ